MQSYTEWKLGTAAANDDSVGTIELLDPQFVLVDDIVENSDNTGFIWYDWGAYSIYGYVGQAGQTFRNHDARLIIEDQIVGTNQATDTPVGYTSNPFTDYMTVGGASNLFGLSEITPRQIRRNSFGVALSFCDHASGGSLSNQSYYLTVTGFSFKVPLDATITGVEIRILPKRENVGGGLDQARIYTVRVRVHYSIDPVLVGRSNKSAGYIKFNEVDDPEISQSKAYQYLAYENNEIRGAWRDVLSIPSILNAVNQLPGELNVELGRNLDTSEPEYEEIELSGYSGETLGTTQNDGEAILAGSEVAYAIGEGTDLEVDHTVKVREFYGGFEDLGDHNGVPLLTHQGEQIQIANGYPRGRMYYHGYVSDYGFVYDENANTTVVKLLHLSDELNNEVYKTPDTLELDNYNVLDNSIGFGGWIKYFGENEQAGFTFRAPSTFKLKRFVIATSGWRDNIITATVRTGSTMGSGTIVGVATATIPRAYELFELSYAFPAALNLTSGSDYNVVLTSQFQKQTGSQSYPAFIHKGPSIANHAGYKYGSSWSSAGMDIAFQLWEEGGDTRVNELSIDPSQIQRKILDYNVQNGGKITYNDASIVDTGTIVSAPFNMNTLKEAGDYILKLVPTDWFYYVDPGELLYNLRPRPENVDHWFTLKKDIIKLQINKNIENILNEVYFTGGGDPALLMHYVDAISRGQWRKGLAKLSDNRVTDDDTGQILMEAETGRRSQPIWIGTLEVLRSEHPRIVHPGQIAGFRNIHPVIAALKVQMMSVNVTHDRFVIQLGTQPPKTSKRIEDIKRNLTRLEIQNAPDGPV